MFTTRNELAETLLTSEFLKCKHHDKKRAQVDSPNMSLAEIDYTIDQEIWEKEGQEPESKSSWGVLLPSGGPLYKG